MGYNLRIVGPKVCTRHVFEGPRQVLFTRAELEGNNVAILVVLPYPPTYDQRCYGDHRNWTPNP